MPKQVVIVGAGRQGRNVAEILGASPATFPIAGFLDDGKAFGEVVLTWPVLGSLIRLDDPAFVDHHAWFVALGANDLRQRIGRRLRDADATIVNAIHPNTDVSPHAEIGVGIYMAAYAHVGSGSQVGDWALLEGSSFIGSDAVVGTAASLGPTCVLTGGASVGDLSAIGAGTVIVNGIRVGSGAIVAANAAVVRDVPDGVRAQGVPARIVPLSPD
jgi:sugar O-acyltransferase (sialic acid O-acetyltransferase NeuD family)